MDFDRLIKTNVKQAFKIVGNLAPIAEFIKTEKGDFDFSTGEFDTPTMTSANIKVIVTNSKKTSDSATVIWTRINFISGQLDVKAYDTVILKGNTWKIGPTLDDNGYVSSIDLYREVANG